MTFPRESPRAEGLQVRARSLSPRRRPSTVPHGGAPPLTPERLEPRRLMAGYRIVDLGTLGGAESFAYGLNDSDVVVGYANDASGRHRAFRFADANGNGVRDPGEMTDLGALAGNGHQHSAAWGINDAGQIVGTSRTALIGVDGLERAVRFNPGTSPTDL